MYKNYYFQQVTRDPNEHISDQELLDNFYRDRNNNWLGVLFQRYTLLLLGVGMKYLKNEEEAKDSVQQIFLKAITELHKYKVEYFKSWLYMVAKNHCLMKLRDRQHMVITEISDNVAASPEDNNISLHLEKNRRLELMNESLAELSKEQQLCVTLFYLEKKSYQQITDETGFSVMQVKSYIQNGKRNLKLLLEKKLSQR